MTGCNESLPVFSFETPGAALACFAARDGDVPSWFDSYREASLDFLGDGKLPTKKSEDWKYTDLRGLIGRTFRPGIVGDENPQPDEEEFFLRHVDSSWRRILDYNGRILCFCPVQGLIREGASFSSLKDELKCNAAFLQSVFIKDRLILSTDPFSALNRALFSNGIVVRITALKQVKNVIDILHLTSISAEAGLFTPWTLIVLEAGSSATIVERFLSRSEAVYLSTAMTKIVIGKGACLNYVRVQAEGAQAFHFGSVDVAVEESARYRGMIQSIGAQSSRTNVMIRVNGEGGKVVQNGLFAMDSSRSSEIRTHIVHGSDRGNSDQLIKGILADKSHGAFSGRIKIDSGTVANKAYQINRNLVLSDQASIDTKPELSIDSDDVQCSHGATVGQIDEEESFYLRSRGFDENQARSILCAAFASEVIDRVDDATVKHALNGYFFETFERFDNAPDEI